MAFKKLTTEATTKTHGEADATILDILLPTVPLAGTTENLLRGAAHLAIGWVGRGYKENKTFGF